MPDKADDELSDSEWLDGLSPTERKLMGPLNIRRHHVNLERVQRIHLDIEDEPMEFSAETIAQMLEDIAEKCFEHEAFLIRGIINALIGEDHNHLLVLKHKRRGKFVSPTESSARHNRQRAMLYHLAELERQGVKTEAAVAELASLTGLSRASVFAEIRAAEQFLEHGLKMSMNDDAFRNPRPAKT